MCGEKEMINAPSYLFHWYDGPASLLVPRFSNSFIWSSRTRSTFFFHIHEKQKQGLGFATSDFNIFPSARLTLAQQLASMDVSIASIVDSFFIQLVFMFKIRLD